MEMTSVIGFKHILKVIRLRDTIIESPIFRRKKANMDWKPLGTLTEEMGFEEYIQTLSRCNKELSPNMYVERRIGDYVYSIKGLFKKINDNYENEFSNKFFGESNKKIGPAFYVNAVTSHQNAMLIAYLLEKSRWDAAIASCHQRKVPGSLIKPQNVTKNLKNLNSVWVSNVIHGKIFFCSF